MIYNFSADNIHQLKLNTARQFFFDAKDAEEENAKNTDKNVNTKERTTHLILFISNPLKPNF